MLVFLLSALGCSKKENEAQPTDVDSAVVIYTAATIHTLNPDAPSAEAVAVDGGYIVGVGGLNDLQTAHPGAAVDEAFANHTITPGLIDPHMHVLLGSLQYSMPFATPWPMAGPDGVIPGYDTRDAFLARLAEIVAAAPAGDSPVFIYGYHNLVQGDLVRADLDAITSDRPLFVWHYSTHDFYLNSKALDYAEVDASMHKQFEGVDLDEQGELTGRIYEDALPYLFRNISEDVFNPLAIGRGAKNYFAIMRRAGVTATADLAYGAFGRRVEDGVIAATWSLQNSGFRLYMVPEYRAFAKEFGDEAPQTVAKMAAGEIATAAPVLPRVKFFTDARVLFADHAPVAARLSFRAVARLGRLVGFEAGRNCANHRTLLASWTRCAYSFKWRRRADGDACGA